MFIHSVHFIFQLMSLISKTFLLMCQVFLFPLSFRLSFLYSSVLKSSFSLFFLISLQINSLLQNLYFPTRFQHFLPIPSFPTYFFPFLRKRLLKLPLFPLLQTVKTEALIFKQEAIRSGSFGRGNK